MPVSDPLEILLEHDKWTTHQILLACEKLTAEQFAKKFAIGAGSLQATVTHILGAMRTWTDTLAQQPPRSRLEQSGIAYSPTELMPMLDEATGQFAAIVRAHPVSEIVKRTRDGKEYTFTRGAILAHVATHGMHHRAQCLNMLKQLGVSPLPPSSVAEWTRFEQ